MQLKGGNVFEHVMHREREPAETGSKGACSVSQELGSCVTPSPEPGSETRAWLWGLVEGCLPLSYFFPLTPCEPHPLMLSKPPPLAFHGVRWLIQEIGVKCQGEYCRAAMRNIGKKFISVLDASLDSWSVEQHGRMRGEMEGQASVHGGLAKVTNAYLGPEAVEEGLGESCGRHRRADTPS